ARPLRICSGPARPSGVSPRRRSGCRSCCPAWSRSRPASSLTRPGRGPAWTLLPGVLLASPLITVGRQALVAVVAFAVLLPPLMTAAAPAIAVAVHRAGVPPPAAHGQLLAERMLQEWRQVTDRPLLLVGGELDLSYSAAFYLPDRPVAYPTDLWWLAPWVDAARIARDGISL